MARVLFCDYHNMVTILEKGEHNTDFHPMVDFLEASPLRYALIVKPTVYVSHLRQFWSTARIETTEEGTKILATVDGIVRTVSESSLRRNLKLRDKKGISSLLDVELFKNLTLMGYNISPNQKFTFQNGQFSHQWKYLIHTIMQCLSPKSTGFNEFSSNISTVLVCLATNRTYNFSKMIFDGLVRNINNKVSKFLIYPRFLAKCLRMSQFGQITHTETYVVPFHIKKLFTTLWVNSPSFSGRIVPLFDAMLVPQGEGSGTPTEPHHTPSLEAQTPSHTTQPTSSLPPVSTTSIPTVTPTETTPIRHYTRRTRIAQSSVPPTTVDEPASLQRDVSQGEACPTDSGFIADQDKATMAKVKVLEDRKGVAATRSGDDAPIKRKSMDEGEAATERISDDTEKMAMVLTSIDAATVLAGGIDDVSTGSGSIPTAVFATATVVTPYSRRKGKEVMVESDTLKKQRLQEQIDAQSMIDGLDRNNETIAKYLQRKRWTKKKKRDYYMAVIRNNLGWKVKDFKGMTFEEVEAKFNSVYKQMEDFIPMGSKEEAKRYKRKGIRFDQESSKKLKSSEEVIKEAKSTAKIPKEKIKEMMQLIPIEEVYVAALQVKHPIIDWKVHTEGHRSYWKIIRLGGSSACYQFFVDLLKHLDRDDLNQLWALVKEYLSIRPASSDKEMELWVELKRLYEPDPEDQLWAQTQNFMHAPVEWKLYDLCGVHQVTAKDKEIFMLVEKDYPLRTGLALVMICYKLQVENFSQMANDIVLKICKIANSPRHQEQLPTASEVGSHWLKKYESTARKIALLC
nr:hypothetical protein [Tanacetum cinerariifolium]